ncbi:MFS transporter, partial [Spirillospora sp. NPDC049652]
VVATLAATCLCLSASWTVYTRIDEVTRPAAGGDPDRASLILLFFGAGAVCGNFAVGRLTDRFGPARVIVGAAPLLVAAVTVTPPIAATFAGALAAAVCWGTLHWMINVPQQLRATAAAPSAAPLVLGLHQSTIYIGISIGGATGAAGDALGGRAGIGYAALLVGLAGLAVLVLSLRLDRRTPPAPDPEHRTAAHPEPDVRSRAENAVVTGGHVVSGCPEVAGQPVELAE